MRLTHVELRRLAMPLTAPFRTAHGVTTVRDVLLVRVIGPDGEGWGECVAESTPSYWPEYVDGAHEVMRRFLVPLLGDEVDADMVNVRLSPVQGHRMAKAAIEAAVWDGEGRAAGRSLASVIGATRDRVPAGVAVGMQPSLPALLETVERYVAEGYVRVKLKIEPGHDVEPVRAVRERFPDLMLQVDANQAYTVGDVDRLRALDPFDLLLIEQPLPEDDLLGHAEVAARLRTPICLDESIVSAASAKTAIEIGACSVVNIKPGRVGGLTEAIRIHDMCLAAGVGAWCGGMLETGVGRALNVALAALPGFTLPGDLSASSRYFAVDATEPFVLEDGHLRVPGGPGIGVTLLPHSLERFTTSVETLSTSLRS